MYKRDVPCCSRILSAGNFVLSQLGVLDQYGAAVTVEFFFSWTETDELIVYVIVKCRPRGDYKNLDREAWGRKAPECWVLNSVDTNWSAFNYYRSKTTRLSQSHPYWLAINPVLQATFAVYNAGLMTSIIIIVTRTPPATYVYGIYHHTHSARHVRLRDLESHAKLVRDLESSFKRMLPWQRDLWRNTVIFKPPYLQLWNMKLRDSSTTLRTLCEIMNGMPSNKVMFSEVFTILRLVLTIPVTTATAERTFSTPAEELAAFQHDSTST